MRNVTIRNVRCVPKFEGTLLSVDQWWQDSSVEARFGGHRNIIVPAQGDRPSVSFPFKRDDGTFEWKVDVTSDPQLKAHSIFESYALRAALDGIALSAKQASDSVHIRALSPDAAISAMHRRLHVPARKLKSLIDMTTNAPKNIQTGEIKLSEEAALPNATRRPHVGKLYEPSHVGRLLHMDTAGPFVRTKSGHQYMLLLVDDHSRFKHIALMKTKDEALLHVRKFVTKLNAMLSVGKPEAAKIIGTLHSDKGGEFLSRDFTEFLDEEMIRRSVSPAYIHQLNGVAERGIRTIMEHVRSDLGASGAPISFWGDAALHAVDIINRVYGPPDSKLSSMEHVTGVKPKIMGILPFGCRAYAVKARPNYHKTTHDERAWPGVHLGRDYDAAGAYRVWVPEAGRVVTTSDVYFDETLFPWLPEGERRVADAMPLAAPADDDAASPLPSSVAATAPTPSPPPTSAAEAFDRATLGEHATARASNQVLLLFSGRQRRSDGLSTFLKQHGDFEVEEFDNNPSPGDTPSDLSDDATYAALLRKVQAGTYFAIFASPPCSTFSISRFFRSATGDGGPPIVRTRKEPKGIGNIPRRHLRELNAANLISLRTATILLGRLQGRHTVRRREPQRPRRTRHRGHLHQRRPRPSVGHARVHRAPQAHRQQARHLPHVLLWVSMAKVHHAPLHAGPRGRLPTSRSARVPPRQPREAGGWREDTRGMELERDRVLPR